MQCILYGIRKLIHIRDDDDNNNNNDNNGDDWN
jgi:hypothetical protein